MMVVRANANLPNHVTFKRQGHAMRGFTLVELLVVLGVIGILAALLLPTLSMAKARARRTVCVNNTRQVNLRVQAFCGDHDDTLMLTNYVSLTYVFLVGFKEVKFEWHGNDMPVTVTASNASVLLCPDDRWAYGRERPWERAGLGRRIMCPSYYFNGKNTETNRWIGAPFPGIAGKRLGSIREPAKTVLIAEHTAFAGGTSLHDPPPKPPAGGIGWNTEKDARNMVSFVDGHVRYIKIFHNGRLGWQACESDPNNEYDYRWSGE